MASLQKIISNRIFGER